MGVLWRRECAKGQWRQEEGGAQGSGRRGSASVEGGSERGGERDPQCAKKIESRGGEGSFNATGGSTTIIRWSRELNKEELPQVLAILIVEVRKKQVSWSRRDLWC